MHLHGFLIVSTRLASDIGGGLNIVTSVMYASTRKLTNQWEFRSNIWNNVTDKCKYARFRLGDAPAAGIPITAMRLQNAVTMLRETSFSVGEIANQCGYADPNYFSKHMKTKLGMPPSEFRKRA